MTVDAVIPAVREDLVRRVLGALDRSVLRSVIVVWDGAGEPPALDGARVLRGRRAGPAAARNTGWRASDAEWIAFLDDDVVPAADWASRLRADIAGATDDVAGIQGRVEVPLPVDRAATDWERNVARLADTPGMITADFCCRRAALAAVGGFDERFGRAYREDSDLELRLADAGWCWTRGSRAITHPVRPAPWHVALKLQRGNRDDVLFWALHGARSGVTFRWKLAYLAMCVAAVLGLRGSRLGRLGWLLSTARFFGRRAAPGPRSVRELAGLAVTSVAIPPSAVWWTLRGLLGHRSFVLARLRGGTSG